MKNFSAVFSIVKEKNCPLYKQEERLSLSDKTLSCPDGKEMCLILVRDLTELLFKFLQKQPIDLTDYADTIFNCSGCTGLIKFSMVDPVESKDNLSGTFNDRGSGAGAVAQVDSTVLEMYGDIVDCSLLQAVPQEQVEILLSQFQEILLEE